MKSIHTHHINIYIYIHKINITIGSTKIHKRFRFIFFCFSYLYNFTIFFSLKKRKIKIQSLTEKFFSLSLFFFQIINFSSRTNTSGWRKIVFRKTISGTVNLFYAVRKFLFLTLPAFPMDSLVDSISYNRFSFSCSCSGASVINSLNLAATCFHFTRSAGWNGKVRSISRVEIFIHVFRDSSLSISNIWIRKLNRWNT